MNKLKEKAFEIATGGVIIVLLALIYLLVYQPLSALGTKREKLESKVKELKIFNDKRKTAEVPTKEYAGFLMERQQVEKSAVEKGAEYYKEKTNKFQLYFNDAPSPPDQATFVGAYTDGIKTLREDYQKKFGVKVTDAQANPDDLPPKVSIIEPLDETKIPTAMKEYWITEAVFKACTALDIGGLLMIDFPLRTAVEKAAHPYYGRVQAWVTVELPFSKVENLISRLLADDRVPFILDELEVKKKPESLAAFKDLAVEHKFKEAAEAQKASYEKLVPEPNVVAVIKLVGVDWKGVPVAEAGKEKDKDKEEPEEKKKK